MITIPQLKMRNGNSIPKLGFGTWMIGGAKKRDPNNDDIGQVKAMKYAMELRIEMLHGRMKPKEKSTTSSKSGSNQQESI